MSTCLRQSAVSEKSKMYRPIRSQGGNLCWWIVPKHKIGIWHLVLAFSQVSLNADHRLKRSRRTEAKAAIFVDGASRETQSWLRILSTCFLSSFFKFRTAVVDVKSKMSHPIRGQGGHLYWRIGFKNKLDRGILALNCFLSSLIEIHSVFWEVEVHLKDSMLPDMK